MKYLLCFLNSISLLFVLLCLSIQIPAFSMTFYKYEYKKLAVPDRVQMSNEDLYTVTKHMLSYLKGKEKSLNVETTVNGQIRHFFNDRELAHMADVLQLFKLGFTIRNIALSLIVITYLILALCKVPLTFVLKFYRAFFSIFLVLIGALTASIAFDFSSFFTLFHKLSFSNDLWLLDPRTDLLINIVPQGFFIDISIVLGSIFLFSIILIVVVSMILIAYKTQNKAHLRG